MPKAPGEVRKRGKKKKKQQEEPEYLPEPDYAEEGPSWISKPPPQKDEPDLPFGAVEQDLKAYFRSVDLKLGEWSTSSLQENFEESEDERSLFLLAAMSEVRGKELQLATDPECSRVLERLARVGDDGVKRALLHSFSGENCTLANHLFGSRVSQTLARLTAGVLQRELQGIETPTPQAYDGVSIPSVCEILVSAARELLPASPSMISHVFSSHVLREFLLLLSAETKEDLNQIEAAANEPSSSKGPKRPQAKITNGATSTPIAIPKNFLRLASLFLDRISSELSPEELKEKAFDKIASPSLQVLLKVEFELQRADRSGSLLDCILPGVISEKAPDIAITSNEHFSKLACDSVGSHLLELVTAQAPDSLFRSIWRCCFSLELETLILDPLANFVAATAFGRVDEEEMEDILRVPKSIWNKCVEAGQTGVMKALVDRAVSFPEHQAKIVQLVSTAFGVSSEEDRKIFVPKVMALQPISTSPGESSQSSAEKSALKKGMYPDRKVKPPRSTGNAPTVQGALLLQSILRLQEPHNSIVCDSIVAMHIDELMTLCKSPIASRVVDALLESQTVSNKVQRTLIMALIGHYQVLAEDKLGSRVCENFWKASDPYLREKVARSLVDHEAHLRSSPYGRYFIKNVNLWLLKSSPDEWRRAQAEQYVAARAPPKPADTPLPAVKEKRKRESQAEDTGTHEKKKKSKQDNVSSSSDPEPVKVKRKSKSKAGASDMDDIFKAIKLAPS